MVRNSILQTLNPVYDSDAMHYPFVKLACRADDVSEARYWAVMDIVSFEKETTSCVFYARVLPVYKKSIQSPTKHVTNVLSQPRILLLTSEVQMVASFHDCQSERCFISDDVFEVHHLCGADVLGGSVFHILGRKDGNPQRSG